MSKFDRKVIVIDGNVEKALRKFKKKIIEMKILQEVRDRQQFVKPTTERKIKKSQAKRRWERYLRDQSLQKKLF